VLYDRHGDAVYGYLARRVGRQAAEDLTSEVFLRALEARYRTRAHASGSALPWLYGIARNVVYRQLGARSTRLSDEHADPFEWSRVDARLDASNLAPTLHDILAGLSTTEREVLLLVSWEQLPIGEAAEVLGISAGAARTRLHRARTHASAALAAHPDLRMDEDEAR
jgi:RNA polymerase sigma factor (sigma-70 family)